MAKFIEYTDRDGILTLLNTDEIAYVEEGEHAYIFLKGGGSIAAYESYASVRNKIFAPDMEGSLLTEDEKNDFLEAQAEYAWQNTKRSTLRD